MSGNGVSGASRARRSTDPAPRWGGDRVLRSHGRL